MSACGLEEAKDKCEHKERAYGLVEQNIPDTGKRHKDENMEEKINGRRSKMFIGERKGV